MRILGDILCNIALANIPLGLIPYIYIPYTYTLRIPIPHIHKTYTLHQPNWSSRIASSRKSRIQVTHGCILVIRRPGDHGPTAGFPKSRGGPQKKTDSDGLMVI